MTKTQGFVFFGIIIAGLIVSVFTLNKCGKRVEIADKPPVEAPDPVEPAKPKPPSTPSKPDTPAKPAPAPIPSKFDSADALVGALVQKIRERDFEGFLEIAGPDAVDPNVRAELERLFNDPEYVPDPDNPMSQLAKTADSVRWAIKLSRQSQSSGDNCDNEGDVEIDEREIYIDVVEDPVKGWRVRKVLLPKSLTAGDGKPGSPAGEAADALTVAHTFARAIIARDFELARNLTDPEQITDERVAALIIALEEGKFQLRKDKPLVVTLSRDDLTWVLTRVETENASSEFAVEMGRKPEASWLINGLTFSKLIASLADMAGGGGVAYAPIVADPQGGDSIVLYFEFDDGKVNQRTARQLEIVAQILRRDPARLIHINGHADALGTDQYNEQLSDQRATSVRQALIDFGVAQAQIKTKGFGEAVPRRPNFNPDGTDNPGGRSQNRRAEVYLDF